MKLAVFKSTSTTNRFNKNQKVWVVFDQGNYLQIKFRWKGSGRYVNGILAKWPYSSSNRINDIVGNTLKEVEVTEKFYTFIQR